MDRNRLFVCLLLGSLMLSSFKQDVNAIDAFKNKATSFIKRYETDFHLTAETVTLQGMFEKYTAADWAVTASYQSKKPYQTEHSKPFHKRLFFSFYYYEDPAKVKLCLDTICKCFPPECAAITKDVNMTSLNATPAVYIFNKNKIITCHVNCGEETEKWPEIEKEVLKAFAEKGSVCFTTECGGPLKWSKH